MPLNKDKLNNTPPIRVISKSGVTQSSVKKSKDHKSLREKCKIAIPITPADANANPIRMRH